MSFQVQLQEIQKAMLEDGELCVELLSNKQFINALFFLELRALINMFQSNLQRKPSDFKANGGAKSTVGPQVILTFYSIAIMRSKMILVKDHESSQVAIKNENQQDSLYNIKLAIESLTKLYRGCDEGDVFRSIITGLLLKIKGFNNYKMIVKDLNPSYISEKTLDQHADQIRIQCPNLFEAQIIKFKNTTWSKYLRFKPISLASALALIHQIQKHQTSSESSTQIAKINEEIEEQFEYLNKRVNLLGQESEVVEKINIEELTMNVDAVMGKLKIKIKETVITRSVSRNSKQGYSHILPTGLEYDQKQHLHKVYLTVFNEILKLVTNLVVKLKNNWWRKIKWLYNFIIECFTNFTIRSVCSHESIALSYKTQLDHLIKLLTAFYKTFKDGLFPKEKLRLILFDEEYSLYKLIEAILYNQYDFTKNQYSIYQNYQKAKKTSDAKNKQAIIDIVNINMKSLNLNLHYDIVLGKIIPALYDSQSKIEHTLYLTLHCLQIYYAASQSYYSASKLLLMIDNSKNSEFIRSRKIKSVLADIREIIYDKKSSIRVGLQYFCEEYFHEAKRIHLEKIRKEQEIAKSHKRLGYVVLQPIQVSSERRSMNQNQNSRLFKKTESYDAMEGWGEHFESVEENSMSMNKLLGANHLSSGKGELINNQVFYSLKESNKSAQEQEQAEPIDQELENQVILPQF